MAKGKKSTNSIAEVAKIMIRNISEKSLSEKKEKNTKCYKNFMIFFSK